MTTSIGRAVFVNAPSALAWDGDTLTMGININVSSRQMAQALTQQVQGLANNDDEPIVPVASTDDPTLDGFYVVVGVNVDQPRTYLFNNLIRCTIGLRRIGSYSFPQLELITGAVTRTNAHGLTGEAIVAAYHDIPNAITGGPLVFGVGFSRVVADSATPLQVLAAVPPVAITTFSWWAPPSSYYVGAARVEVNDGGNWYTVGGRQVSITDNWRISNGMIRLSSGDGAAPGTLEVWSGSAWESRNIRHFDLSGLASRNIGLSYDADRSPMTVIRNAPERVIVRCAMASSTCDYSVSRGARHVEIMPAGTSVSLRGIGLDTTHAAAATAITGGIRATANDANGNQVVFGMAGGTLATNLTSGLIYSSGAMPSSLMAGVALDGSTATVRNAPADLMNQFIGIAPVKQRVVTR